MKNFGIGLGVGVLGAILWVVASGVGGAVEGMTGERSAILYTLVFIGAIMMVGGPLAFWVIRPIVNLIRRKKENG